MADVSLGYRVLPLAGSVGDLLRLDDDAVDVAVTVNTNVQAPPLGGRSRPIDAVDVAQ